MVLWGEAPKDSSQLGPPPIGHLGHEVAPRRGDTDTHAAAVSTCPPARYQALADQPVTHPGGGGRLHAKYMGQVGNPLWAASGQFYERPVLGEGHVLGYTGERAGCDGHKSAAGPEHCVDQLLTLVRAVAANTW